MPYSRRRSSYSHSTSPNKRYNRSVSRSRLRSRSRSPSSDVDNPGNNLYVTGLSPRITKRELEKHFAMEGKVVDVHLVVDPWTRESRGFGFVTMSSVEEADCCVKYLNCSELEGRVITVEKARRRRGRTPTPGRYLGLRTCVDELQATLLAGRLAILHLGATIVAHLDHQTQAGADHTLLTTAAVDHTLPITDEDQILLIIGGAAQTLLMRVDAGPTHGHSPLTADHQYTVVTGLALLATPGTTHQMIGIMEEDTTPGTTDRYCGKRYRSRDYSPDDSYYERKHRYRSVSCSDSPKARRSLRRSYSRGVLPRRRSSRKSFSRSVYSERRSSRSCSPSVSPIRRSPRSRRVSSRHHPGHGYSRSRSRSWSVSSSSRSISRSASPRSTSPSS